MCIYDYAYNQHGGRGKFWDYVKEVHRECGSTLNEECSRFGHKRVKGLDWKRTQRCVKESFSSQNEADWDTSTVTNYLFENEKEYYMKYGPNILPSIVINNSTYKGQFETQAVMNAICAGFQEIPSMCKRLINTKDIEHSLGVGTIYFNDGYQMKHLVVICVTFTLGLILFLCFYRRHAKRKMKVEMNRQIESAVNHYVALSHKDEED